MLLTANAAAGASSSPELADVFRRYGDSYRRARRLPLSQLKVMDAIEACRTARLGGHREWCERCGFQRYTYHSCRNRHCPKCQTLAKAQWIENRASELLRVPYFHNVFTIPHELNLIVLNNMRVMLTLLFQAASKTLLEFGRNNLGGQMGFTMVLHTWDQTLGAHFHLHCIIPGGVLAAEGDRWISTSPAFLFRVELLSTVFRAKFLEALKALKQAGQLNFPAQAAPLATGRGFAQLLDQLYRKPWVVYTKRPFAGPLQVLEYLGRYTHRVAISNDRIVSIEHHKVSFRYRDRSDPNACKLMSLDADEFIRRFLLHVLPKGFMRIRHFGFLANRCKRQRLSLCRQLLGGSHEAPEPDQRTAAEWMLILTGQDITRCPRCGQGPLRRETLPPLRALCYGPNRRPATLDSS